MLRASLPGVERGWQCRQLSHPLGNRLHASKSNVYSLEIMNVQNMYTIPNILLKLLEVTFTLPPEVCSVQDRKIIVLLSPKTNCSSPVLVHVKPLHH